MPACFLLVCVAALTLAWMVIRQPALHRAVSNRDYAKMERLASDGVDLERRWVVTGGKFNDVTALHLATMWGDVQAVEILLEAGADPNILWLEKSPLHLVVLHEESAHHNTRLLLNAGADASLKSGQGDSIVHIAADWGLVDVVDELAKHDVDMNAPGQGGTIPLTRAGISAPDRLATTVQALLEAGADPNLEDANGVTPIQHAIRKGDAAAVSVLLDAGARAQEADVDLAASNDHAEIVRILKRAIEASLTR